MYKFHSRCDDLYCAKAVVLEDDSLALVDLKKKPPHDHVRKSQDCCSVGETRNFFRYTLREIGATVCDEGRCDKICNI